MPATSENPAMNAVNLKLLAVPCAGASATMYLRWSRSLHPHCALLPVELPGRGARADESFADDYNRLVAQLCHEHRSSMQGDYVLFGHSMGALLAYGMACHQRAHALPLPRALILSACAAPSRRDPDRFAARDDDALIAGLRKRGGTPESVFEHSEFLRMTLDILRADYRICAGFNIEGADPLPFPLHVLAGRNDDISVDSIEAWQRETCSQFSIDWFDGGHFFIRERESEVVQCIAEKLRSLDSKSFRERG